MRIFQFKSVLFSTAFIFSLLAAQGASAQDRTTEIFHKLNDPDGGVFIVAHRGCHNPYPARSISAAPENSIAAIENCIRLGVDMMETDIRRSKDGALVIMHDDTVDRTTNGLGKVGALTLKELQALRLRQNFGGAMSPQLSDERVMTLDQLLAASRNRIMLNLDIKEAIYPEVIAAVARAGMTDQVLVKTVVDKVEPPLADQTPYALTSYIPIIAHSPSATPADLARIAAAQFAATRRPPAVEMVDLEPDEFEAVRAEACKSGVRLWGNTLTSVGVVSNVALGGDVEALRDPTAWDRQIAAGISVFQTDEPAFLLDHLATTGKGRRTPPCPAA